jgi:hypothetical protein
MALEDREVFSVEPEGLGSEPALACRWRHLGQDASIRLELISDCIAALGTFIGFILLM